MASLSAGVLTFGVLAGFAGIQDISFSLMTPRRVAERSSQIDFMLFAGVGLGRNTRVLEPPASARYADRFRLDMVTIWSDSTRSLWTILPSRALDRAHVPARPRLIEPSVIAAELPAGADGLF